MLSVKWWLFVQFVMFWACYQHSCQVTLDINCHTLMCIYYYETFYEYFFVIHVLVELLPKLVLSAQKIYSRLFNHTTFFFTYFLHWNLHSLKIFLNLKKKMFFFLVLLALIVINWSYHKTSSIRHTKSQNLNVSCILLQLSSLHPLKPVVKLRMKI